MRILCVREFQNSIKDSVHKLLSDTISRLELDTWFDIKRDSITSKCGSEFIFEGLHHNLNSIRGKEGIDICWNEEGQLTSEESWQTLIPTIRKDDSEIWVSFNPENIDDPTYKRFITKPPQNAIVRKVSWRDNPWFPKVLDIERKRDMDVDPDLYAHIWEGEPRRISTSQVLHGKWVIDEFETPEDAEFMLGIDWGFANDPLAVVRCYVKENTLYIDRESGAIGVEITETEPYFEEVFPHKSWPARADSARPELISYFNQRGWRIEAAKKGPGSVEDGIAFLRSFDKIVIHSRCRQTSEEARLYSYKQNKLTNEVLPIPIDAHNHFIDALRYGVECVMVTRGRVSEWSATDLGL
jgi:phage terminase large subunit